ncbi:unnamed protein product [Oncorhynchus mykiss]|uniref:FERM F1 lobe ubiquitin-like domain-containing protein n=1 Tax=Oncorhynchus mykiss TaxID=8022 RepID=A0A060Z366_ONCMY|nr:unnamed protein product [Oncorhynchus mykiss]
MRFTGMRETRIRKSYEEWTSFQPALGFLTIRFRDATKWCCDPAWSMMSRRGRSKSTRTGSSTGQCEPPQGPGVHVYLFWTKAGERYLTHTEGKVTAEELSISAAQTVGITPLCHVLFSLYDPESHCWYSPNHFFNSEEQTRLTLHYRMRLVCVCVFKKKGPSVPFSLTSFPSHSLQFPLSPVSLAVQSTVVIPNILCRVRTQRSISIVLNGHPV